MRRRIQIILLLISGVCICTNLYADQTLDIGKQPKVEANVERIEYVVRYGQGGFRDSRSPENKLGGGQLALDIKPKKLPLALSISSEFYKNSRDATHSYEIDNLIAVNLLYYSHFKNMEKLKYFLGGGIGRLKVPKEESDPYSTRTGDLVNLEAGLNYLAYEHIGFYGVVKYLRAEKSENNIKVIDFSEKIVLLGITFNFSF